MRRLMFIGLVLIMVACGGDDGQDEQPTTEEVLMTQTPDDTPAPTLNTEGIAAMVNGHPITITQLDAEVDNRAPVSRPANLAVFKTQVLEDMIDQVLIVQFAQEQGLITDEAVAAEIEQWEQEAADNGRELHEFTGYPADMTEDLARQALASQAVYEYIIETLPETVTQVHARHILVKNEATARDMLQRLAAGEDFAALAEEFSKDGSTAPAGGDLGWIAPGDLLQPEVEAIIFDESLPANSRWPEPVASPLGYHVIEVLERSDTRPLTEEQRYQYHRQAFQEWLTEQRAAATITRYVGQNAASAE